MKETDLRLADGRTLHTYDTEQGDLVVFWHHGTPDTGLPPEPLFEPGLRWVSYDRPRYGGSSAAPDRDVASAAADAETAVADALGVETFALLGHSGGDPHALACAASLPDRVRAVAAVSGLARSTRRASTGSPARARTARRWRATRRPRSTTTSPTSARGGFDPVAITAKALVVHGADDRMVPASHAEWLARRIPGAELLLVPGEGHHSVLNHAQRALAWLRLNSG